MQIQGKLDANVLKKAEAILGEQSLIPVSPVDYDRKGELCLCAAALLANAGLHVLKNTAMADEFRIELARTKKREVVYSAFEALGWPPQLCAEMMKENDATAPALRPIAIRSRLRELY